MKIAVIGGLDRSAHHLAEVAETRGHRVEFHDGHVSGRGREVLRRIIERADVVVVETRINSHEAVRFARQFAEELGRSLILAGRLGTTAWTQLLDQLDGPAALTPPSGSSHPTGMARSAKPERSGSTPGRSAPSRS